MAKRYGWSFNEIKEDMYWEDVYPMYEYAYNLDVMEKNHDMHFNFMLHATTKEAMNSWKDMALPFPDLRIFQSEQPLMPANERAKLSVQNRGLGKNFRRNFNAKPMSQERRERRDYVAKRQAQHMAKIRQIQREQYIG